MMIFFRRYQKDLISFSSTKNLRKIGPTKILRNMFTGRKHLGRMLIENQKIVNGIRTANSLDVKKYIPKRKITYEQRKEFIKEGYDIKIMNSGKSKDSHINGHYALYEQETNSYFPQTHWKESDGKTENPITCNGDLVNNPAYSAEKSFVQRLGTKTAFRCVNCNWWQLARVDYEKLRTVIKMRRIMRENPEDFSEFQQYYRKKIHDNKNLDWEEKNNWAAFLEWQETKNKS